MHRPAPGAERLEREHLGRSYRAFPAAEPADPVGAHRTAALMAQDRLVPAVPGATPRVDGPAASHPWERQLKDLERAVAQTPECPPPLPSWWGVDHRRTEDAKAKRLQLQRRKMKTADEAAELDKINRELGVSAPRAGVI